jgi:acyl-CoA thioester hydrolase
MFTYNHHLTVRYGDTDQMGYNVYNDTYGIYIAQARTAALRSLGTAEEDWTEQNIKMHLIRVHLNFVQPAYCDDRLTIKTSIENLPGKQMLVKYEIRNQKEELISKGETYHAFANADNREAVNAPEVLVQKLNPFFGLQTTPVVSINNEHTSLRELKKAV